MKTIISLALVLFIQISINAQVTSFSARVNEDKVSLKWTADSDKEINHFTIEKSTDGRHFTQAGIVFAFHTAETITYPFNDKNINAGKEGMIYYRISAVGTDGKAELLKESAVKIHGNGEASFGHAVNSNVGKSGI